MPSEHSLVTPGRRALLRGGLLAALVTAGCSPDPTVHGSHAGAVAPSPGVTPTVPAAQRLLTQQEADLAAWLTAAAALPDIGAARAFVLAAANQCRAHAARLAEPDPLAAATPSATPTAAKQAPGASWEQAAPELTRRATALSAAHRVAALAAEDGSTALLHGSLAVAAHAVRRVGPAPLAAQVRPVRVEPASPDQARLVLVSQLRALVQGLQVGIGRLPLPSDDYQPARDRLAVVMGVRDQVLAALDAAGVEVPPAEVSYAMPGGFTNPSAIRQTWGRLEAQVLDAWGGVVAAASGDVRAQALDQMVRQADQVRADGLALDWWPGWA